MGSTTSGHSKNQLPYMHVSSPSRNHPSPSKSTQHFDLRDTILTLFTGCHGDHFAKPFFLSLVFSSATFFRITPPYSPRLSDCAVCVISQHNCQQSAHCIDITLFPGNLPRHELLRSAEASVSRSRPVLLPVPTDIPDPESPLCHPRGCGYFPASDPGRETDAAVHADIAIPL